jgi:hypothetical protein
MAIGSLGLDVIVGWHSSTVLFLFPLFCGHKGLALLALLSGKGCQAVYIIDNTVDFLK